METFLLHKKNKKCIALKLKKPSFISDFGRKKFGVSGSLKNYEKKFIPSDTTMC